MKDRDFKLHDGQMGAAITVRITPKASQNEISEILDDGTIKVRLTAPAGSDKTNQALIAFLAEVLQVKPAQVEIVAGAAGNDKLITIMDLDKNSVHQRIIKQLK